nr:MAG TPA: hypothetical protein [Caudoviricetes sp.]
MFQYHYVKMRTGIVIEGVCPTKRSCPDRGSS